VAGSHTWRPSSWWIFATLGFLAAGAYFSRRRTWLGFALALGALFFVGALDIQLRNSVPLPGGEILAFADGHETFVIAHVMKEGEFRAGSYGGSRQSIDVETEEIRDGVTVRPIQAGLRLGVYAKESDPEYEEDGGSSPMRKFRYGERVRFPVKLRAPRNFRNPGAFDYEGYLADNGIVVLGATQPAKIDVLPGVVGTRVAAWRERIHHNIVRKVHALWPADDAALMDAAVIGESVFLTPETKTDFQRSGTYHILVVSGMNVSILAFVVFWVMRRCRLGDVLASLLMVILCTGYAFVTDVRPPV
jgi:competence protein ComEC